ncbi:hypothetical protein [Microbispora sp. GKU 823]|uniref:hypothetical protein n=1 Tax=Microbispora sp. GKU 823 TaxID=1652100 RepID=UPI00211861C9|nr:hypothetical protein [Microbispora sp. GKU 823]
MSYRPGPDDLSYTFGGRPAVESVAPGAVLELYTEDCFGGRVRGTPTCRRRSASFRI